MKWRAWLEIRTRRLPAGVLRMEAPKMRDKCLTHGCNREAEYFCYHPCTCRLWRLCRDCAERIRMLGQSVGLNFRFMPLSPNTERLPDLPPRRGALPIVAIETAPTPPAIEPDAGKLSEADGLTDEERRTLLEGL